MGRDILPILVMQIVAVGGKTVWGSTMVLFLTQNWKPQDAEKP